MRARAFSPPHQHPKLNPKRFWPLFKYSSKKSTFPQRMTVKNPNSDETNDANDPNSIADLFNKYFASVFHNDSDLLTNDMTKIQEIPMIIVFQILILQ